MECPKCQYQITRLVKKCESCGYQFDSIVYQKLSLYFDLKTELNGLNVFKEMLSEKIKSFSQKIKSYEKILIFDLKKISESFRINKKVEVIAKKEIKEVKIKSEKKVAAASVKKPEEKLVRAKTKKEASEFELAIGQKWILLAGLLTTIFGVGYFLKYSFEQGWIGPAGRVAMAYLWGIIFLVSGKYFYKKDFKTFGLSIIGGGIATFYFSTFAAFQLYQLFGDVFSFAIMMGITIFACFLAVIYDNKWLAALSVVGGFLTPVLLSTGSNNYMVLFTYMAILNAGILGVAFNRKWEIVSLLGFIFTYILYCGWFAEYYNDETFWPAIIFLNIYFLIYTLVPFAYQQLKEKGDSLKEFFIVTPNALLAFSFSFYMIDSKFSLVWVSTVSIMYAVVFLAIASYLFKQGKEAYDSFVIFIAQAALFVLITIPIIFSGNWITVFWSAIALVLLWMGQTLKRKSIIWGAYVVSSIVIIKLISYDYPGVFGYNVNSHSFIEGYTFEIVARYITLIFSLGILYVFGLLAERARQKLISSEFHDSIFIYSIWGFLLFLVLNFEVAGFFTDYLPGATFVSVSVLWTMFSVALMVLGFKNKNNILRKVSLGLFAVTILKVFFSDMARVSTPYRILSFIVLGLVLLGTSFLYYKYKDELL